MEDRRLLSGIFQFSTANFYVGENGGTALVTVTRSGNLSTPSNVNWATANGSALAGSDYDGASGVLGFSAGETSQTFTVRARTDSLAEANESLQLVLSSPTGGATLGSPATATLTILDSSLGFSETRLTNALNSPVTMAVAPDGRVFVAEQGGRIRVVKNGALLSAAAYTVNTTPNDEEGLVGLTVDPNFGSNGYLYVNYTVTSPTRHNVVARITMSGDTAVSGSEIRLFDLDNNGANFHVGGALHFASDGTLLVATGDNADANNSASLATTHGKILRLNPGGSIPTNNPFYNVATGNNRAIWALGLRNAFTFDVQPGTGRVFISEVGAASWEEVNEGAAGANFGWPLAEGPVATPPAVTYGTYRNPVHAYDHSQGIAITGAAFYNPANATFPSGYQGKFFFTEYVNNEIRWIDPNNPATSTRFGATSAAGPVDVRVAPDGALYYLSRGNSDASGGGNVPGGSLFRISYTGTAAPSISVPPADLLVSVGATATFSVVASGPGPFSYQWQRDGNNIGGATGTSYTTPSTNLGDDGALFRVVVSNGSGSTTSSAARLGVTSDQPPVPVINFPTSATRFSYGDLLQFSGFATDPEQGTLNSSALTWRIDYYTGAAQRPAMAPVSGISSGAYSIGTSSPYKGADVFYRVWLTAVDSQGLSTTTFRDVLPNVARFTIDSNVAGLVLTLDGAPFAGSLTFDGVAGLEREIGASAAQAVAGITYRFLNWSDNGTLSHVVYPPAYDTGVTARYEALIDGSATLVNWSGDYVSTDTAFQRYNSAPVESGLDLDGDSQFDDYRWYVPFSDGASVNPLPGGGNAYGGTYNQGNSWRFYGGALFHSYSANFSTRWAEVWGNAPGGPGADHIYLHAGSNTATDGWEFVYWKKEDFLSGSTGVVQFGPDSNLNVGRYLGSDGLASANSGWIRFVVRDGNQFYISQEIGQPQATTADFSLFDPNSRLWAPYNPQGPANIRFNANGAPFAPHFFANVTAVGVYHSNDNSSDPSRHAGINFAQFSATGVRAATLTTTPGFFDRDGANFFLKNTASQGLSDDIFPYGIGSPAWIPLAGDWNGDFRDSVGFFYRDSSTWYLKNTLGQGLSDVVFPYGPPGTNWIPLVGDWNGDNTASVGFYDPTTATWYLKNSLAPGLSDLVFNFGPPRNDNQWVPVVGDWNGDGLDTIGFYERSTSTWYLKNSFGQGFSDVVFNFGPSNSGWVPLAGDWDGNGVDSIGFFHPATATWYFKNSLGQGLSDAVFTYGPPRNDNQWPPLVGDWDGRGQQNLRLAVDDLAASEMATPASPLTNYDLAPVLNAALGAWASQRLSLEQRRALANVQIQIADLPGDQLGAALGPRVLLDVDAAGRGWYVDRTPELDEEFLAGRATSDRARNHVDLWTALVHELGHLLGLDDLMASDAFDVMSETLPVGVRRQLNAQAVDRLLGL